MKRILAYFKYYKWQSLLGPLFKLLEATFELLVPVIVGLIVDRGLGEFSSGGYPNADKTFIVWMCVVLAAFGFDRHATVEDIATFGQLKAGIALGEVPVLYPRLDIEKELEYLYSL